MRPTVARVDLEAVRHNVRALASLTPAGTALMAVVKADAYGHGAVPVARAALEAGARWLGVALVEEALELREADIGAPILVLGPTPDEALDAALARGISLAVFTPGRIDAMEHRARALGLEGRVHLKVDTGMGRVGSTPEEAPALAERVHRSPHLRLEGAFSHFATADEADLAFARHQLDAFRDVLQALGARSIPPGIRHMANTAGILALPASHLDLVRAGIGIYGIYPSDEVARPVELRPVLRWTTRIAFLREVPAGTPLSYGRTHVTSGPRRIAVLPVGYADGYPRLLSNRGSVLVGGRRAPVVGRVCMDMTLADVTGVPGAREGDEAVLIGRQAGEEITADEVARLTGTIAYEVTCNVGRRVPREYVGR